MNSKKVAKGSFYIFISQAVKLSLQVFLFFFLAKVLGPAKYGQYSAVFAFCLIIQVLFKSGFTGSISKSIASDSIASDKDKQYALAKFGLKSQLIWSTAIFLTVFMFADFFSRYIFNDISFAPYLKIASLHFVPLALFTFGYAILVGQRKFGRAALLLSFSPIIQALIILIFLFFWRRVSAVFYAIFLATLLSLIPMKFIMPKIEKKECAIDKKHIINIAFSLIISAIALTGVFQVDKIFIKNMLQKDNIVGFYALASNFSLILQLFAASLIVTLFPSTAASFAREDLGLTRKYVREGTRYLLLVLLPLSFGLTLIGKDIILFIFGNQYLKSIEPLAILIFGSAFFSFFLLYRQLLVSLGKHWASVFITILILAMALVINPLFIKRYDFMGAAWATLICSTIGAFASGSYIFRLVKSKYPWGSFLKIFAGSGICFCFALLASTLNYIIRYGIYMVLVVMFVMFLRLFRELTREDWQIVKSLYSKDLQICE